ncbi:MAG: cytoplasmic protein [Caldimicrobium sp.]
MYEKFVFFAFRGDSMCFIHVLLNALELASHGKESKIVFEGESVKLLPELYDEKGALHHLYKRALEKNLIAGVCKACSQKFGTYEFAKKMGLTILEELSNHASMWSFIKEGYQVITM